RRHRPHPQARSRDRGVRNPRARRTAMAANRGGQPFPERTVMNTRRRFRELIAQGRLVLMPGAYDALSARIMEAEGFDAIIAGGYAAIGSMMGQADMGQCNVRDYADHYARICAAVNIPVYVDGDTGFGGVNNVREMVRAFESAGVAGLFFSDQVFP